MKKDGKEVGSASVYAEPHTMSGKKLSNVESSVTKKGNGVNDINMRGYGAATKGRKISGKMG